ncbi:autotransporter-associated beta strand repeat-containing protein [Bythopirellula goksoeyrii]|uniref:Extracellular serine protease n=1 Tax=Bythopirellula goksoeyrii TaxID=1400387 RepID=A0A5B9QDU3_9BACT|nr:autotransporter-associated beta strand repeat-containing protein [Bythopirellula goksoeyrii]QEG35969.1 Extracellular serine protease precursor [Bythopirellula goksoeyrii]
MGSFLLRGPDGLAFFSRALFRFVVSLLVAMAVISIAEAIPFQFTYDDAPDEGFWDPILGDNRRAAMERAGQILGSYLIPSFEGEVITVRAVFENLGPTTNASTSSDTLIDEPDGLLANRAYPSALANHLLGQDLNVFAHDIKIRFNSTVSFYTGLDGSPSSTEQDLIRVAMHEMTHGLGFTTHFLEDGDIFESPSIYDGFITVGSFGTPLNTMSTAARAVNLTSDNLFWSGANGVLGNAGMAPKIYAPNPYLAGSTLSHLDEATYTTVLMTPFGSPGQLTRSLTPRERGMLLDMGWTVNVFPQTTTWAGAVSNLWLDAQNWSPAAVPTNGDNIVFDTSSQTDVEIKYSDAGGIFPQTQFLNSISFTASAPSYTLRFGLRTITEITGPGFASSSAVPQTIVLESFEDDPSAAATLLPDAGADMIFRNSSSAGNLNYELHGDVTVLQQVGQELGLIRHGIVRVDFLNNATAGTASFDLTGGSGDGAFGGVLSFKNSSTAGSANLRNRAGRIGVSLPLGETASGFGAQTIFSNAASAMFARIDNDGSFEATDNRGTTHFNDLSTAMGAAIVNHGSSYADGTGGATFFNHNSTAAQSTITNESALVAGGELSGGTTVFDVVATAGNAIITNQGSSGSLLLGGLTRFRDDSTAGTATIHNNGSANVLFANGGVTQFFDDSTAGGSRIHNYPSGWSAGRTEFHDFATAGTATIDIEPVTVGFGGAVYFNDNSNAAQSNLRMFPGSASSVIRFDHEASAGNAHLEIMPGALGSIEFYATSTAQNSDIDVGSTGVLNFFDYTTAGSANIDIGSNATGTFNGGINFPGVSSVSADQSTITVRGGGVAGSLNFAANATAGNAQIVIEGGSGPGTLGGLVSFGQESSNAGASTILVGAGLNGAPGGRLAFALGAKADLATIITQQDAVLNLLGNQFYGGTSIGSLVGTGGTVLMQSHLNVGGLGLDGTFDGQLIDPNPADTDGTLTKIGGGTLILGGANTYDGVTTVAQGTLNVNGSIRGGAVVLGGATLGGTGSIEGGVNVLTGGIFSPGTSPGVLTVDSLTLQSDSEVRFELGTLSDQIVVHEDLTLGGSLVLSFLDGFVPLMGESFTLFSGSFGTPTGQFAEIVLPQGVQQTLDINYADGLITLGALSNASLIGDFDSDLDVDGNDFLIWHRGGSPSPLSPSDLNDWQLNFGNVVSNTVSLADIVVPEPPDSTLLLMAAMGWVLTRYRWNSRVRHILLAGASPSKRPWVAFLNWCSRSEKLQVDKVGG